MLAPTEPDLLSQLRNRRDRLVALPGVTGQAELVRLLELVDDAIESFGPPEAGRTEEPTGEPTPEPTGALVGAGSVAGSVAGVVAGVVAGGTARADDAPNDPTGVAVDPQCRACGIEVEPALLEIDPLTALCLECLSDEERFQLEQDLHLAAKVQSALLPSPHLRAGGWESHYRYQPLRGVSGDYADLLPLEDRRGLYFLFGDVSGKGFAASLLMSHLQALFRTLSDAELCPDRLLRRVNRAFARSTLPSSFATAVAGRLEPSGRVLLANAGHNPPLLLRRGEIHRVASTGLPLGVAQDSEFGALSFELGPSDTLFLYTDGVTEATDPSGEEFGLDRLVDALAAAGPASARDLTRISLEAVAAFAGAEGRSDDQTVMALRRLGEG